MEIVGEPKLKKLKRKNRGNIPLSVAIDKLIKDIRDNDWESQSEMITDRPDADKVYEGFYFFDINIHRTLILVEFEDGEATITWCGSHDEYELTFKNNKDTIQKWLKDREYI